MAPIAMTLTIDSVTIDNSDMDRSMEVAFTGNSNNFVQLTSKLKDIV